MVPTTVLCRVIITILSVAFVAISAFNLALAGCCRVPFLAEDVARGFVHTCLGGVAKFTTLVALHRSNKFLEKYAFPSNVHPFIMFQSVKFIGWNFNYPVCSAVTLYFKDYFRFRNLILCYKSYL